MVADLYYKLDEINLVFLTLMIVSCEHYVSVLTNIRLMFTRKFPNVRQRLPHDSSKTIERQAKIASFNSTCQSVSVCHTHGYAQ